MLSPGHMVSFAIIAKYKKTYVSYRVPKRPAWVNGTDGTQCSFAFI